MRARLSNAVDWLRETVTPAVCLAMAVTILVAGIGLLWVVTR